MQDGLVTLDKQRDLACMHACIVSEVCRRLGGSYGAPLPASLSSDAIQTLHADALNDGRFTLATQLLELTGCAVPARVNGMATGALLRAIGARLQGLFAAGAGEGSGGQKVEGLDLGAVNIDEAAIVIAPVAAVLARASKLLMRYEGQPMLLQLQTICERLLGAHLSLPNSGRALPNSMLPPHLLGSPWPRPQHAL
jgi:hypothetical protein